MTAQEAYILAKAYTKKSIEGEGSLKGAACQIKSIEAITGGHRITFEWEDNDGEVSTDTMDVMDGANGYDGVGISSITYKETDAHGNYVYTVTLTDTNTYDIICPKGAQGETGATGATGNGIASIEKTSTAGLVDTYTITYTNGQTTTFTVTNGESITVDSAMSGSSTNPVQNKVITEALELKQNATENSLETEAKTIVGAINEHEGDISSLKSGLTNLNNEVNGDATVYPYADVITIEDAVPANLAECSVKIEPVQDLHGYDHPWVGGASKNKLPCSASFPVTIQGVKWDINDDGSIIAERVSASSNNSDLTFYNGTFPAGEYIFTSLNSGEGSGSTYQSNIAIDGTSHWGTGAYYFELSELGYVGVTLRYYASNTGKATFVPMLRDASITDDSFAPYTNVCPISGHTEVDVQRDGKNLLNIADCSFENGTVTVKDGLVKINGTFSAKTILIGSYVNIAELNDFYGKELTFSKTDVKGNMEANPIFFTAEGRWDYWHMSNSTNSKTITLDMTLSNLVLYLNGTLDVEFYLQVELGSTATPYEPYSGKTYTIALGDTVYGGTVDFDSGVMTVTHKLIDMSDSSYTYSDQWGYSLFTSATFTDKALNHNFVCEAYKTVAVARDNLNNGEIGTYNNQSSRNIFAIRDDRFNNASDFRTAVTGYKIAYELATPTTIQLTPQQIQLLKGQNTLTASTGQISVTVNGVAGAIGAVQEQVNELSESVVDRFDDVIGWSENKNLLPLKLENIKYMNRNEGGTWSGNVYTHKGVSFEVLYDDYGNVNGFKINGTPTEGQNAPIYLLNESDNIANVPYTCSLGTEMAGSAETYGINKLNSGWGASQTLYDSGQLTAGVAKIRVLIYDGYTADNLIVRPMLRLSSTDNTYEPYHEVIGKSVNALLGRVPKAPTTDGTYTLTVTVASGVPTYSWVSGS